MWLESGGGTKLMHKPTIFQASIASLALKTIIVKCLLNSQPKYPTSEKLHTSHMVQSVYLLHSRTLYKISQHISLQRNHLSRDQ